MTSPSSEAMASGENTVTAQADPPTCGAPVPSAPLPQRVSGIPLPATSAREIRPLADLDLLHRVLDGLKRL
jgi:hypothetical protein